MTESERVTITDALAYIRERTGYDFSPRQFRLWLESGEVEHDGAAIQIEAHQVEGRWYVRRSSLDAFVTALLG
jgi:hypothetical protein